MTAAIPPQAQRRRALRRMGQLVLSLAAPQVVGATGSPTILAVRVWPASDYTRVTIESDQALDASHHLTPAPERLVVDLNGLELNAALRELVGKVRPGDPYIAGVRVGQYLPRVVRLVLDLKQPVRPELFTLAPVGAYRHRLVFDLFPTQEVDPLLAASTSLLHCNQRRHAPPPSQPCRRRRPHRHRRQKQRPRQPRCCPRRHPPPHPRHPPRPSASGSIA